MTAEEMYTAHENGETYAEIGSKCGKSGEAVRGLIRRQRGADMFDNKERGGALKGATQVIAETHGFTEGELKAILSSAKGRKPAATKRAMPTASSSVKLLVISDTHIGHDKFHEGLFDAAVEDSADVDIVLHPGDHLEGMSGRPGHVYELTHMGYQRQIQYCRELYERFNKPIYGIDGNHDQWYKQKNNAGVVVGQELEKSLPNYTHLGEWEGDLHIGNLWIKLFHANDGSAYSTSYKSQKLIESFSGGEKPNIVFSGHYHKALYHFIRNVHTFESGTLCGQTQFMRGKKLAAHMGYWKVTVYFGNSGVSRMVNEFVPYYE